jgi:hypothetical protein
MMTLGAINWVPISVKLRIDELLMDREQGAKNDAIAIVGVRGGWERGGGLVLTLVGRDGRWGKKRLRRHGQAQGPRQLTPLGPLPLLQFPYLDTNAGF